MNPYRDKVKLEDEINQSPEDKAWNYFKELVGKDSVNVVEDLKNGKYIEVVGSKGGKYYLYPNGAIGRMLDTGPSIGRVNYNASMPKADFLSAIYTWITQAEDKLINAWGCGNLSLGYDKNVSPYANNYGNQQIDGVIGQIGAGAGWDIPNILRLEGSFGQIYSGTMTFVMGT